MRDWVQRILNGDKRAIARAATAIENRTAESGELLKGLFPHTGKAVIAGVTGAPGAGKSTLVDQLTKAMRTEGSTAAVVAVDPSSPFTGGAILGDRIRMQQHHADDGVFIRSMATRGHLGGLARATLDVSLLLDAAGFDTVFIETVGVGQGEVEIARIAGVCAVVLVPGMGDDVQALKAGIMEIASVFIINKADLPGANKLEQELRAMLALSHAEVPIVQTVASEGKGIPEALAAIRAAAQMPVDGRKLWEDRLREMLRQAVLDRFPPAEIEAAAARIARRESDPYSTVDDWLRRYLGPLE